MEVVEVVEVAESALWLMQQPAVVRGPVGLCPSGRSFFLEGPGNGHETKLSALLVREYLSCDWRLVGMSQSCHFVLSVDIYVVVVSCLLLLLLHFVKLVVDRFGCEL